MRGLRNLQILAVACCFGLGLSNVAWAQDNNGQSSGTTVQPVNKPVKPQPVANDGADSSGPYKSKEGMTSQIQSSVSPNLSGPDGPSEARLAQDQAKMRNLDRQKKLVDETAKLVSLANELKADVEKSNKDTLSLDVIRKADEIEKLARSVKEKMKGS